MKLASLKHNLLRATTVAATAALMAGCASVPGGPQETAIHDPLEGANRAIFAANEAVDKVVIRPVTEAYVVVVPDPVRQAIHNFTQNLLGPIHIANNLLQGNIDGASHATGRFLTNSIGGLGGVLDVASAAGVPKRQEDFGQTLAVWGVEPGPYIVLPLLGPSNLRDTAGLLTDSLADPFTHIANATDNNAFTYGRFGASVLDRRSQLLTQIDDLRRNSIDYYATVRSLYGQQRAAAIRNGADAQNPEFPEFD